MISIPRKDCHKYRVRDVQSWDICRTNLNPDNPVSDTNPEHKQNQWITEQMIEMKTYLLFNRYRMKHWFHFSNSLEKGLTYLQTWSLIHFVVSPESDLNWFQSIRYSIYCLHSIKSQNLSSNSISYEYWKKIDFKNPFDSKSMSLQKYWK